MICSTCNGTGKKTITVRTYGSKEPPTFFETDCFSCDGAGTINKRQAAAIEFEKNMWCKCTTRTNSYYVPDGKGIITKHHYLCSSCDKITQIG